MQGCCNLGNVVNIRTVCAIIFEKESLKLTSKKIRVEGGRGERKEGGNEEVRKNVVFI